MLYKCDNLINIDLSSFNIQNDNNTNFMFYECDNLKEIKMNKNFYEKLKYEIDENKIKIIYC